MNLKIIEPVAMKIFKDKDSVDTRTVSDMKQAMYYIQCYDNDEVYGEITINGKTYIVGADHVEAAF